MIGEYVSIYKISVTKQIQLFYHRELRDFTQRTTERNYMKDNDITAKIIGCAINDHKALGPGLLESAYTACLNYELIKNGLFVEKEKPLPLIYEKVKLECGYRGDFFVEKRIIVEVKSVDVLNDIHLEQTPTYLKLAKSRLGLLINFNVLQLKSGVKRVVNGY